MVGASGTVGVESAGPTQKRCPTCGAEYPGDYAVCPRDATPLARIGGSEDPLLGQILGDTYELTRKLGEGGMGRVYEARHVRLGRRFALKVLHPRLLGDAESLTRFRREATAAAAIVSPHVAQVVDVHAARDGTPYLVSEYLDGSELAEELHARGALEVARAVHLARQLCKALSAAHAAGVVHRDLKPENIMLVRAPDGGELVKVLDFGIAKSLTDGGSLTRTGVVLGTPAYMAPEQARSSAAMDHRVDIYALGAVLYCMLTGRPAFRGEDPHTTLTSVLTEEPERPKSLREDLPDGLEVVVQRAMAKEPEARFASMTELDAALAPFDTSTPASRASAPSAPTPSVPRAFGDVGSAPTVALAEAPTSAATAESARARGARPRAVGYALVSFAWVFLALCGLVGALVQGAAGRALAPLEALLGVVLALGLVAPLAAGWARELRRGAWRNTAEMLTRGDKLRGVLASSLAAYALLAGGARAASAVVLRSAGGPWWAEALALLASLGVAAAASRR